MWRALLAEEQCQSDWELSTHRCDMTDSQDVNSADKATANS